MKRGALGRGYCQAEEERKALGAEPGEEREEGEAVGLPQHENREEPPALLLSPPVPLLEWSPREPQLQLEVACLIGSSISKCQSH